MRDGATTHRWRPPGVINRKVEVQKEHAICIRRVRLQARDRCGSSEHRGRCCEKAGGMASTYRAHDGRLPGSTDIVASRPGIYTDGRVHMHFVELLRAHRRDQ